MEAGELAPEDPVEGSEASAGRSDRGKHAEHIEVHPHVHGTRTSSYGDPTGMANLSAEEPDALTWIIQTGANNGASGYV